MEHQPTTSQTTDQSHDEHQGVGHVVSAKILIATGMALLVLTITTVLAASVDFNRFQMPELNIWVAMGIAIVKASIVVLFFMHLRWDRPIYGVVFVTALAAVGLFIAFAMTDTFAYSPDVKSFSDARLVNGEAVEVGALLDEAKAEMEAQILQAGSEATPQADH